MTSIPESIDLTADVAPNVPWARLAFNQSVAQTLVEKGDVTNMPVLKTVLLQQLKIVEEALAQRDGEQSSRQSTPPGQPGPQSASPVGWAPGPPVGVSELAPHSNDKRGRDDATASNAVARKKATSWTCRHCKAPKPASASRCGSEQCRQRQRTGVEAPSPVPPSPGSEAPSPGALLPSPTEEAAIEEI